MTNRFGKLFAIVAALVVIFSASACATETPEKVTITIWNCDNTPSYEEGLKQIIAYYEAEHPNVTVEYTGLPWDNAKEKFDTAIATNTAPDCAYITQQWAGSLAGTGGLVSLNPYVEAWDKKDEFDLAQIYSSGLAVDDELFMMPFEFGTTLCWYRTDWYKDAGLAAPATFDEFYNGIEKLTDSVNGKYGFSMRGGSGGSNQLESYLVAYAGAKSYFTEDGECFVSDPKVLEGLQRFVDIYNVYTAEGDINNGYSEMCAAFGSDIAAMIYHNNSSYPEHLKNLGDSSKFGVFMMPAADNGVRSVAVGAYGYSGWIMFEDSKNKEATWDFIKFACNGEMQNYWNQVVGGLPTNKVSQSSEWMTGYPALVEIRDVLAAENTVMCVVPAFYPDYAGVHANILQPGFQAVLLGEKSAADFLAEWNEGMKEAKADYEASLN